MDLNLDILKKIMQDRTESLKKMDLSGYEWQQKIKNADEGIFSIEKE